MNPVKISTLIEQLQKMNPEHFIRIGASNAPPWITDFYFSEVTPSEDDSDE
tara:strand:- start:1117 stop:1269 length:153 start_codon:yes stop_codon:yes gene_type:complete